MIVDRKWFKLWKDWKFDLTYRKCGYFDPHPEIHISMFGLHAVFVMPWTNDKWTDECDPPTYGIQVHDNTLWVMLGGKGNMGGGNKWWTWNIPLFTKIHFKHLVETKDGKMTDEHELGSEDPYIYYSMDSRVNKRYTKYIDSYDGSEIDCMYWKESREWRPKWLTWTSWFADKREYIEVDFKQEVGQRKGSWKGGCMGCSYDLLPGETPEECIRRMEKERKF